MDPCAVRSLLPAPAGSRVAIVSGSYGAGHDAAAHEIADALTSSGALVTTYDIAELLPIGLGRLLKRAYFAQLRRAPVTWTATLHCVEQGHLLHRAVVRALGMADQRVVSAISGNDLAIATHPFAAQALGSARRRGILSVPAVTYLTDASVHPLWVNPHVDLHLAIHDVAAAQARRWGALTTTVQPVVRPRLIGPRRCDPLAAYEMCGARALVTGGSLGIGELEASAKDILASGLMTPVVACGRNEQLRERLSKIPGIVALGWRDDLVDVIAACDCVVQNAGGFTSLEALSAGTPVVTYRPIAGHGITNAESLEQAGLAPWPRTQPALRETLLGVLSADRHDRIPRDAPSVLEVLFAGRTGSAPAPWAVVA